MQSELRKAAAQGKLRQIDLYAGLFVERLAGGNSPDVLLAAALASRAVGQGHICLPLDTFAGQLVFAPESTVRVRQLSDLRSSLLASGIVGRPGDRTPLILDGEDRLYLARYYDCEARIGDDLLRRSRGMADVDIGRAAGLLGRLFPDRGKIDWQQQAAAVALLKQFMVISGGPGTGKTYTAARVLALLQVLAGGALRMELAAPTGKAAARLHQSIRMVKETLDPDLASMVPDKTRTVHRLLGYNPHSGNFRHNRDNPLHLDLLMLDEASMIDVPLMDSLLDALPQEARLILLGDRDQLTSVEVGSLFGDICSGPESGWSAGLCSILKQLTTRAPEPVMDDESFADSVVVLQESYRFSRESGIGNLARAVNSGRLQGLALSGRFDDLTLEQIAHPALQEWLNGKIAEGFRDCFFAAGPREALSALDGFRILCALRDGPAGVEGVNRIAEEALRDRGTITDEGEWYRGRPVMIKNNHYGLHLFNGDTGVVWPDGEGKLWAWFLNPDGTLHPVAPARLPEHDTAYAITVHKSQGSEFEEVLFLLPFSESRVLKRDLVYTAITRAKKTLTVCGDGKLLEQAIEERLIRYSGLSNKLWNTI